ncbi:hypothetical protein KGMB01110_26210 [Mediterraneibacter butyricigenes]|uniref:ABC-2 type transporter transmembrane domain-containing protein n=1 Tax=Mediterraneibacter butyricigenes TaxID=2316025 RepID=A0A391P3L4_9FIRM|nr:ABC transporter permease [Mediterraneibacter butyricigenes]GCA68185.1 hypothetical protein KGMB01110_26210 [Mediterraneibacter butyricigenes]
MTVFKGYLKIAWKNRFLIFLYLGIFFGIVLMMQKSAKDSGGELYQTEGLNLAVVDEDHGAYAKSLIHYLEQRHQVQEMAPDKEKLQENLFYENVDYILWIPENFAQNCIEGQEKLSVTKRPGSYTGSYVDQQVNQFLNQAKLYQSAGFSEEEILKELQKDSPKAKVQVLDRQYKTAKENGIYYYFQYIPYLFLVISCYILGNLRMSFRKGDLPKRLAASAVSARRQSLESIGAVLVMGIVLWTICIGAAFVIYGEKMETIRSLIPYYLLNTFCFLLVTLMLAWLVGALVKSSTALNGVANLVSLGMCFLCGIFVPIGLLASGVRKIAQFLPAYWYTRANEILGNTQSLTQHMRDELFRAYGMQILFTLAFFCAVLSLAKWRQES